ncbi:MAG: thioesterase family protein [Crocinitomicaceae bacterium]|nr:thioesterase family protein [Crocinitomicaceae bacterium]
MQVDFKSKTTLRVRYGETDQMGHCYYGNYAQYFEVGRVEALRSIGMSYKELEDRGVMLPVTEFQVNYKFPAKYDDVLTVETSITELRGPRLLFEYTITNEDGILIATATTTLVFVAKETMRPIQPPAIFVEIIEKYFT